MCAGLRPGPFAGGCITQLFSHLLKRGDNGSFGYHHTVEALTSQPAALRAILTPWIAGFRTLLALDPGTDGPGRVFPSG